MIEGFYHQQLKSSHKRLYELIQQLIQLVPALPPPLVHMRVRAVHVRACMCVRACVRACVRMCACVRVRAVVRWCGVCA